MIDFPQMVSVSHQNAQMYVMSLVSGSCLCLLFSFSVPFSCFVYGFFFFLLGTLTVILNASSSFSEKG